MPRGRIVFLLIGFLLPALCPRPFPAFAAERTYVNSLGMEFVLIPSGVFRMGSDAPDNEKPGHDVTVSRDFYLGGFEVTQEQWTEIMGENPSWFRPAGLPPRRTRVQGAADRGIMSEFIFFDSG
ncbi:MAG: SUMF1/EgtB/PvdO family nonheme iron enzyme [Desulfovibrio sp.]|jgi:formylglycine-generating enzyme required for sulfatase activity|nr:SUMF1/EgtB/PvdO family nonheme iron enzyme [Desulfovibrio sp.]